MQKAREQQENQRGDQKYPGKSSVHLLWRTLALRQGGSSASDMKLTREPAFGCSAFVRLLAWLRFMIWKNKMPPIFARLKEAPVLSIAPGAFIREDIEEAATAQAQRESADIINKDRLNPGRCTLELAVERCSPTVESALTGGLPVVWLIGFGFIEAIPAGNKYGGRSGDPPRALDVQGPLANSSSAAAPVRQLAHIPEVNPKKIRCATDAPQRKANQWCEYLLDGSVIHKTRVQANDRTERCGKRERPLVFAAVILIAVRDQIISRSPCRSNMISRSGSTRRRSYVKPMPSGSLSDAVFSIRSTRIPSCTNQRPLWLAASESGHSSGQRHPQLPSEFRRTTIVLPPCEKLQVPTRPCV